MGRFYKTGKSDYIDFIYKQPKNLLLQAVKTAEQQIDTQVAANEALYGRLSSQALQKDKKRRDEILDNYKSEIDTIAEDILANPLNYRGSSPNIKKLRDDISQNLTRGELAAFQSNVAIRDDYIKKLDEDLKSGTLSNRQEKQHMLDLFDQQFQGTNYKGPGDYNVYQTGFLAPNVDLFKLGQDLASGWQADTKANKGWDFKYDGNERRYIVTYSGSLKEVPESEIRESLNNYFLTNDKVKKALGTRMQYGVEGYSPQEINDKINAAVEHSVKKYAYRQDTRTSDIKGDTQFANDVKWIRDNKKPGIDFKIADISNIGLDATSTFKDFTDFGKTLNETVNILKTTGNSDIEAQALEANGMMINPNYSVVSEWFGDFSTKNNNVPKYIPKDPVSVDDRFLMHNSNQIEDEILKIQNEFDNAVSSFQTTGNPNDLFNFSNVFGFSNNTINTIQNSMAKLPQDKIIDYNNYDNIVNAYTNATGNQQEAINIAKNITEWDYKINATNNIRGLSDADNIDVQKSLTYLKDNNVLLGEMSNIENVVIIPEEATMGDKEDPNRVRFNESIKQYSQSGAFATGEQIITYELIDEVGKEVLSEEEKEALLGAGKQKVPVMIIDNEKYIVEEGEINIGPDNPFRDQFKDSDFLYYQKLNLRKISDDKKKAKPYSVVLGVPDEFVDVRDISRNQNQIKLISRMNNATQKINKVQQYLQKLSNIKVGNHAAPFTGNLEIVPGLKMRLQDGNYIFSINNNEDSRLTINEAVAYIMRQSQTTK